MKADSIGVEHANAVDVVSDEIDVGHEYCQSVTKSLTSLLADKAIGLETGPRKVIQSYLPRYPLKNRHVRRPRSVNR
jgi:hypothetical protein